VGTRLRPVHDPDYNDGQVWEGFRKGWVWESNIPGSGQPIAISGVWVNNTFRPYGSGYHINYPLGRVVFDSPLSTTGVVSCEFSFRRVDVVTSEAEWFQQFQFDTSELTQPSQAQFLQAGSGILSQNRVQLPAIVIESVSNVKLIPFEIGSKSRVHQQDVLFHVFSETPYDKNQLHDIIVNQFNHQIVLFDKNAIGDADKWPLDINGTPRASGLIYPELVENYSWRPLYFADVKTQPQPKLPGLFMATCRATVEVNLP
jgi:hypothetical protein